MHITDFFQEPSVSGANQVRLSDTILLGILSKVRMLVVAMLR